VSGGIETFMRGISYAVTVKVLSLSIRRMCDGDGVYADVVEMFC
jgi:hypothetical protein